MSTRNAGYNDGCQPLVCALLTGGMVLFSSLAFAAIDPDVAARQINRPYFKEAETRLRPRSSEVPAPFEKPVDEEVPQGALFDLKKIVLRGVHSLPESVFASLIAKYEGRKVSLGELAQLAREIQSLYLEKGLIAACIIPPQEIQNGEASLLCVETRMGDLHIKDHKYFRKQILERYWKTNKGEILRYSKIQKSLELMNKNPDRRVRTDLRAGKEPGTTDVLLDVQSRRPYHVSLSTDNEGAVQTGRQRTTYGFRHNNFLGFDDALLFGYSLTHNTDGKYVYHRLALNDLGTSLMYGYSYSKSHPQKTYTSLEMYSFSRSASVMLFQELYCDKGRSGEASLGFDAKDTSTNLFSGTITRDRLRVARLGGNFTFSGVKQETSFSPSIAQGLNGMGASSRNEYSSRDATNTFTKFSLGVSQKLMLPWRLTLASRLSGQASSRRLPSAEAYSLGGIDSVRGYSEGDRIADNVLQGNFDLLFPLPFIPQLRAVRHSLTGVVFFDWAYGEQRIDKEAEGRTCILESLGAGIRYQVDDNAFLRVEWGFPLGDDPLTGNKTSRLHFSFGLEF